VLDVGGGRGHFLAKILRLYPSLQGLIFDLPDVVSQSTKAAWGPGGDYEGLAPRVELASGSFFDAATLPKAREGDAYMLRCVCVIVCVCGLGVGAWWMCVRGMGRVCRVVCMTACA
jgi:hypothetical protein